MSNKDHEFILYRYKRWYNKMERKKGEEGEMLSSYLNTISNYDGTF